MFVTNWISTTKIQKISEITNFFRHYFLSRTEVFYEMNFFRSYPEGGSGVLGICIYYVLSYIFLSVIPLSHRYAG